MPAINLNHVSVVARNLRESVRFYEEVMVCSWPPWRGACYRHRGQVKERRPAAAEAWASTPSPRPSLA